MKSNPQSIKLGWKAKIIKVYSSLSYLALCIFLLLTGVLGNTAANISIASTLFGQNLPFYTALIFLGLNIFLTVLISPALIKASAASYKEITEYSFFKKFPDNGYEYKVSDKKLFYIAAIDDKLVTLENKISGLNLFFRKSFDLLDSSVPIENDIKLLKKYYYYLDNLLFLSKIEINEICNYLHVKREFIGITHKNIHVKINKRSNDLAEKIDNFEDKLDELKKNIAQKNYLIEETGEINKNKQKLRDMITKNILMDSAELFANINNKQADTFINSSSQKENLTQAVIEGNQGKKLKHESVLINEACPSVSILEKQQAFLFFNDKSFTKRKVNNVSDITESVVENLHSESINEVANSQVSKSQSLMIFPNN